MSCLKDSSIHPINYHLIDANKLGEKLGYESTLFQESSDDSELDEERASSNAFDPFSQPDSGRGSRIKIQCKPSISRDLVDQRYKKINKVISDAFI